MKQVDDERTALLADRSKNEMMSRLNRPIDVSIPSRTEIDSAIKIAEVRYIFGFNLSNYRYMCKFISLKRMLQANAMPSENVILNYSE